MVQTLALLEPALMVGESAAGYRDSLARAVQRFQSAGATVVVDEFLEARWPEYRAALDKVLPGAFEQAVTDARTAFEADIGLLDWSFGEVEASQVTQPIMSVLGGRSEARWPRFGETHRMLLSWCPQAEGLVVPGATHLMQLEDPRAIAEALAGFWGRHQRSNGTP